MERKFFHKKYSSHSKLGVQRTKSRSMAFSQLLKFTPHLAILLLFALLVYAAVGDALILMKVNNIPYANGTNFSSAFITLNLSVTVGGDATLGKYNISNVTWLFNSVPNGTRIKYITNGSKNVSANNGCLATNAMNCTNYSIPFDSTTVPDGMYNLSMNLTYNDTARALVRHRMNVTNITVDNNGPKVVQVLINKTGARDLDSFMNNNSIVNFTVIVLDNVTGDTYKPNGTNILFVWVNITAGGGAAATSSARIVNITNLTKDATAANSSSGYYYYNGFVNLSAISNVSFNFTNISVNISFGPLGTRGVQDHVRNVYSVANSPRNSTSFIGYNLSVPRSSTCLIFNASNAFTYAGVKRVTTNLSIRPPVDRALNFTRIAYSVMVYQNKSMCGGTRGGPDPTEAATARDYVPVAFINFTNLTINQTLGRQLESNVRIAVNVTLANRSLDGDLATIGINATHASLNYSANITLFGIRIYGSTMPGIFGTGPSPSRWNKTYGRNLSYSKLANGTNYSFTVTGFSSFNISDNVSPIITINDFANNTNVSINNTVFNITLNGTGTPILNSSLNITFAPETATLNFSNMTCKAFQTLNTKSDTMMCNGTTPTLRDGLKNITVTVRDTGNAATGNVNSTRVRAFIMSSSPTVSMTDSNSPSAEKNTSIAFFNTTFINLTFTIGNTTDKNINFSYFINASKPRPNMTNNATLNQSKSFNITSTNDNVLGEGNYSVVFQANNSANRTGNSTVFRAFIDRAAPYNIRILSPGNVSSDNDTIVLNFNATDNLAPTVRCNLTRNGVITNTNITIHTRVGYVANLSQGGNALPIGVTDFSISCYDNATNKNSSNNSVRITRTQQSSTSAGSGGGGGGGGGRGVSATVKAFTASPSGTEQALSTGDKGLVTLKGKTFPATVTAVTLEKATVILNGVAKTITVGQSVIYDVDADNTNDVEVTLTKTLFNRAIMHFKEISVAPLLGPALPGTTGELVAEVSPSQAEPAQEAESDQAVQAGTGAEKTGTVKKTAKKQSVKPRWAKGPLLPILVVIALILVALYFRYQRAKRGNVTI